MATFIPKRMWKTRGPVAVSAKIRQRRSKKMKVQRKGELLPLSDRFRGRESVTKR